MQPKEKNRFASLMSKEFHPWLIAQSRGSLKTWLIMGLRRNGSYGNGSNRKKCPLRRALCQEGIEQGYAKEVGWLQKALLDLTRRNVSEGARGISRLFLGNFDGALQDFDMLYTFTTTSLPFIFSLIVLNAVTLC